MSKIKTVAKGNFPFFCKDVKEVLAVNDGLKKKIQEIEADTKRDLEVE